MRKCIQECIYHGFNTVHHEGMCQTKLIQSSCELDILINEQAKEVLGLPNKLTDKDRMILDRYYSDEYSNK